MAPHMPFDLQLFARADEEEEFDDELEDDPEEGDEHEEESEEEFEALAPEEQNKRLRAQLNERKIKDASRDAELAGMRDLITEIRNRPAPSNGTPAPAPRELSPEERDRISAERILEFNQDPDTFMEKYGQKIRDDVLRVVQSANVPADAAAFDDIVDRYVSKWKTENPTVGDKAEKLFRDKLDAMPEAQKSKFVRAPAKARKEVLDVEMDAAAYRFLKDRIKPKTGRSPGTPNGNRSMSDPPTNRRAKQGFTDSQKAAMKRAGMTDEKIKEQEQRVFSAVGAA